VIELPDLEAHAREFDDIPDVVKDAAAKLTGYGALAKCGTVDK
jgi:hypothetical protein